MRPNLLSEKNVIITAAITGGAHGKEVQNFLNFTNMGKS